MSLTASGLWTVPAFPCHHRHQCGVSFCFELEEVGVLSGSELESIRDSHYRTVFSVRASGSSLPDHDRPLHREGLSEFRAHRLRVQTRRTPSSQHKHSCGRPACGYLASWALWSLWGWLDLLCDGPKAVGLSPAAFWVSSQSQHLPLHMSVPVPV